MLKNIILYKCKNIKTDSLLRDFGHNINPSFVMISVCIFPTQEKDALLLTSS